LVVVVFSVGQGLEGTVLTPKLVGDRIGLHPVAVIFAVLAGGQLFGFVGILLALPAAAVIMVLLRRLHSDYRQSALYSESADSSVDFQEGESEASQFAVSESEIDDETSGDQTKSEAQTVIDDQHKFKEDD
jgi:hypothetical protein